MAGYYLFVTFSGHNEKIWIKTVLDFHDTINMIILRYGQIDLIYFLGRG